jgi:hypothetical protein
LLFEATNAGAKYNTTVLATETGGAGKTLVLPLDEVAQIVPFLESSPRVSLSVVENGATFVEFEKGWCLFPAWIEK